jgi:hypothetical protein
MAFSSTQQTKTCLKKHLDFGMYQWTGSIQSQAVPDGAAAHRPPGGSCTTYLLAEPKFVTLQNWPQLACAGQATFTEKGALRSGLNVAVRLKPECLKLEMLIISFFFFFFFFFFLAGRKEAQDSSAQ